MPPKYYKCVAIKEKKPPKESGESSNTPSTEQTPALREFTELERNRLARRFSMVEIHWLMHHNNAKVGDLVDIILAAEARASPKKDNLKNSNDNSLQEHRQEETDSEPEETVSIQYCYDSENFGRKEEMVKCHKCGDWYHTCYVAEPARKGAEDPNFSFWLSPKCKPDLKLFPGYKFTYWTKAEIEADRHYEDTDSDEPDLRFEAP